MDENKNMDSYLFEDNVKRYFLKDMLIKKPYLKTLTISEIDSLVRDINVLMSNLQFEFKNSKKVWNISDENNWDEDSEFRDIILYTILDRQLNNSFRDGGFRFTKKLKKRWDIKEEDTSNK